MKTTNETEICKVTISCPSKDWVFTRYFRKHPKFANLFCQIREDHFKAPYFQELKECYQALEEINRIINENSYWILKRENTGRNCDFWSESIQQTVWISWTIETVIEN